MVTAFKFQAIISMYPKILFTRWKIKKYLKITNTQTFPPYFQFTTTFSHPHYLVLVKWGQWSINLGKRERYAHSFFIQGVPR